VKTIKPRLQPTAEVYSAARLHADQILPVLERLGPGAIAIVFDGFSEKHPSNARNLPRLLGESFPADAGGFDCIIDFPGQRWFFLRSTKWQQVRDAALAVLNRTGLIRFARVFIAENANTLTACWPACAGTLNFSSDRVDSRPHAGIAARPFPASDNETRRHNWRNSIASFLSNLFKRLSGPLPAADCSNGERLTRGCPPAREPGTVPSCYETSSL